jgi:hypothetical protein
VAASANRSIPRGRQMRSRQRRKATDSPHRRQRLDQNEVTALSHYWTARHRIARRPTSASTARTACVPPPPIPAGGERTMPVARPAERHRQRSAVCGAVSALAVESFVVRTAVNRGAAVRMMRSGALLLLLVEVGVGVNRSSYT